MSQIKSNKTIPELILKKEMKFHGFIYQPKNAVGNPDFINYDKRIAVFIDGCFWHKCPKCYKEPKSNKQYWKPKLERNILRRKEIEKAYKTAGWKILIIWEHELKR